MKAEQIPLEARIVAVADALDAMTSGRPYRSAQKSWDEAIRELEGNCDTQFDRRVVEAAIEATKLGKLQMIPRSAEPRLPVSFLNA
jgi:HD-GYP domain-containing protein (c-di-GMP phosphodiesterase class II)